MKLVKKHTHRGVVGVESAIVMIAFVIVAAALAFVVLNMGFSTSQQAKTTIGSSLDEASSALQISGKVIGSGHVQLVPPKLNVTAFPIKIVAGGSSVSLDPLSTTIKYLSDEFTFDNIYNGTLSDTAYGSLKVALAQAKTNLILDQNPFVDNDWPSETVAIIYWSVNSNNNDILDEGEHAVLAIIYADGDRPLALDTVRAEIIGPSGPALTALRAIPSITNEIVDLG